MSNQEVNDRIDNGEFTLYDKFLYGGIGYGYICLPKNLFRVILSVLFPPFGIILMHLQLKDTFPYITQEGLNNLVNNLGDVVWSIFLTFAFWVPGVVYAFQKLKVFGSEEEEDAERFESEYGISTNEISENMIKDYMKNIKNRKKFGL